MTFLRQTLSVVLVLPVFVPLLMLVIASRKEGERRAALISLGGLLLACLPPLLAWVFPRSATWILMLEAVVLLLGLAVLFGVPDRKPLLERPGPFERYDERDHMFSRASMTAEERRYREFYAGSPERKSVDDRIRSRPPITGLSSKSDFPPDTLMAEACFSLLEQVAPFGEGEAVSTRLFFTPETLAVKLDALARDLGAIRTGTTALDENHVYSHRGRTAEVSGEVVHLAHGYAFVFAVEMDWRHMASAPRVSAIVQSALRYWEGGAIALVVAEYLRMLGYEARAHTDANYLMMLPPVAYDAGLGELGRFGSLMIPEVGPRVRLGAVTTDAVLPQGEPLNLGMAEFCAHCLKCAVNCPAEAIPRGDRTVVRGVRKWFMNQERCYSYWREVGSDCGICLSVCPFARPRGPVHNLVRWALARSRAARRAAPKLDDLLYGRRPQTKPLPAWFGDGSAFPASSGPG